MNPGNTQILNPDGRLQPGCYYMRFKPIAPYWRDGDNPQDRERGIEEYEGTLRVVHYNNRGDQAFTIEQLEKGERGQVLFMSGDLYAASPYDARQIYKDVPIFARSDYRFYLLATGLEQRSSNEFDLSLTCFEPSKDKWNPSNVVARLQWSEPPEGVPHSDYLTGSILDEDGNEFGEITLCWVSFYLRRAFLEIDQVDNVGIPLNNYDGVESRLLLTEDKKRTWESVFAACGWRMEAKQSDQPAEPASKIWTDGELHQALPSLRDSFDLDTEWRYHIFCVGKLDDGGRGYKFDVSGGELDNGDRGYKYDVSGVKLRSPVFESVVLAAKYAFAEQWGSKLKGKALEATPVYFRTAVHEVGHALKLEHNFSTNGFMSTTDTILDDAGKKGMDVLEAIEWSFAADDLERLRHWPDPVVRPGVRGIPKFSLPGIDEFRLVALQGGSENRPTKIALELDVKPFEEEALVPLGAPVRILLTLTNTGEKPQRAPRLRFKAGNITGTVELPSGEVRTFAPLAETIDELGVEQLEKGDHLTGSLTLLRGPEGPLFPNSGSYKVKVDLWVYEERQFYTLSKSTTVRVGPFRDEKHRRIAELLTRTPETLVSFAIGSGDGLVEGNQAVNLALNNPVLGPYFAVVRLKRLCRNIGRVRGSLDEAVRLLAKDSKLTPFEMAGLVGTVLPWRRSTSGQTDFDAQAIQSLVINNYLKADLRYVGTRIVLGHCKIDEEPLLEFLKFIAPENAATGQDGLVNNILPTFQKFLRERVGLEETESKELVEMLLVRDTRFSQAIQAYADYPSPVTRQEVHRTAVELGISPKGLVRIADRLREVVGIDPDLIGLDELSRAGELIIESFDNTSEGDLHEIFVQKLKDCLIAAKILPSRSRDGDDAEEIPPELPASTLGTSALSAAGGTRGRKVKIVLQGKTRTAGHPSSDQTRRTPQEPTSI